MDISRKTYLFQRYFNRTATDDEKAELMEWIRQEENAAEVRSLMDKAWREFKEREEVFTDRQSEAMIRHILKKDIGRWGGAKGKHEMTRLKRSKAIAVAAALVAIVVVGAFWRYAFIQQHDKVGKKTSSEVIRKDVTPGGNRAVLTLANGRAIVLDSANKGILARQSNIKVLKLGGGVLKYKKQSTSHKQTHANEAVGYAQNSGQDVLEKVQYNTLRTPRGGQYRIILPDESTVWLNAASSIRFPTEFVGKERKVKITGEAYIEVTKNASKPFIIELPSHKRIEVLGTRFNINAYEDESFIKTTLVEGLIKVISGNKGKLLKPGQQAQLPKETNRISIAKVNIERVEAWKNGNFYFEDDDLASIMRKISRWYDVEIIYKGDIPPGQYTGIISRNNNLSIVLKMLQLSGLQFKIEGKKLIIL